MLPAQLGLLLLEQVRLRPLPILHHLIEVALHLRRFPRTDLDLAVRDAQILHLLFPVRFPILRRRQVDHVRSLLQEPRHRQ